MSQLCQESAISTLKSYSSLERLLLDNHLCNLFVNTVGHMPLDPLQGIQRPGFVKMEAHISMLQVQIQAFSDRQLFLTGVKLVLRRSVLKGYQATARRQDA